MEKKYLVLVINDPYGRDDGFCTHPATGSVLNNKLYNTKEEAEEVANQLRSETSHEEIVKQFRIDEDIFYELRDFILRNAYIHIGGSTIKCICSPERLISIFLNMYGLTNEYSEVDFKHDEELYQRLIGKEPKISVVEIEC